MNRLIIAGSPRVDGRTSSLAHDLFEACIEECPEDELAWVPVSEVVIDGCQNCGACSEWAKRLLAGDFDEQLESGEDLPPRCSIDDDMIDVYELIDDADELTIVSPVYFSGPTAQLKAVLDRLQPYYCLNIAEGAGAGVPKRPAILHVVGEGGDPHGFQPLITIVQSALACAGFKLETVFDWVGKIDEAGEIQEEATVISLLDADAFSVAEEPVDEDDAYDDDYEVFEEARPRLRFDDDQVEERGRKSSEQGKRPGKSGKTEKRQTKGSNQTNNRNKRKENQGKRPSDGRNTGPKTQGGRRPNSQGGAKGGKRRG